LKKERENMQNVTWCLVPHDGAGIGWGGGKPLVKRGPDIGAITGWEKCKAGNLGRPRKEIWGMGATKTMEARHKRRVSGEPDIGSKRQEGGDRKKGGRGSKQWTMAEIEGSVDRLGDEKGKKEDWWGKSEKKRRKRGEMVADKKREKGGNVGLSRGGGGLGEMRGVGSE